MKTVKKNRRSLIILLLIIIFSACDKPDPILPNDSSLKIINDCEYVLKVYFDEIYLGDVAVEGIETWPVSSGLHTVMVTCLNAKAYEETHEFLVDQTTVLTMHIILEFKSLSMHTRFFSIETVKKLIL